MFIGLLFPTTVFATENENISNNASNIAIHSKDELLSEVKEDYDKIISLEMLQEGDIRILGIWNEETYCVEVIDATEPSYSVYGSDDSVKSKTFLFTKENALGIKTNLMAVTAKLTWIKNVKITSFECNKTIYNSNVFASWEPEYFIQCDVTWGRGLNVTWDNGKSEYLCFIGTLNYLEGGEEVAGIDFYDQP